MKMDIVIIDAEQKTMKPTGRQNKNKKKKRLC
jgi:hypothetical protein